VGRMKAVESSGVGLEEWALAHEALSRLRLKRAALDAEEGRWLLRAFRAVTHVHFGYASFGEYIERLFGLNRRTTEEKLRVAAALEELPELAEALRSGKLNWSAVRELSRVAVPDTERQWIAVARGSTAREVERMVSGLARGDRPTDRRRPEFVRHVLRFEVGAETLATFREAMKELQKRGDHRLDDDAALLLMAREVLGGPGDAGRASYQVVVTLCENCGRGFQHANGEMIELDPAIVEMCQCDAQKVPIAPSHAVIPDSPDGHAGNASEFAEFHAHLGITGELAHAHAHAHAHAGNADEPAQAPSAVHGTGEFAGADAPLRHGAGELTHAHCPVAVPLEWDERDALPHVGDAAELAQTDASRVARASARLKRQRATQGRPAAPRESLSASPGGCGEIGGRDLVSPAILPAFSGWASARDDEAEVIVMGDMGAGFTFDVLNRAFLRMRAGAELVVLQKNPFWFAPQGPQLDCGAFTAALEFATGRSCVVVGKCCPGWRLTAPTPEIPAALKASRGAGGSERGRREGTHNWKPLSTTPI
jgi:hypothetical protein